MEQSQLTWITNFIWGIADDVLRDLYVRGKYRDVILPMTVLRRLDAVLEPTKQAVLELKASLDAAQIVHQDPALRQAAGQAFYNTSPFTLRDLKSRANQQKLKADFEAYLDGFSPNVQDILENFEFRNQIPRLSKADALGTLISKFLSPDINLSPNPVLLGDGSEKHPGLDNHAMGTLFEDEAGLESVVEAVDDVMGEGPHRDANQWLELAERAARGQEGMRWTANKTKLLLSQQGERDEAVAPLIAKVFKPGKQIADPLQGLFSVKMEEGERVAQVEPDPEMRDSEQVPLLEDGGIEAFLQREVLPYAPDAWYVPGSVKIGYEVSFTRYFYKPKPLRTLEEIRADILALEKETEGLLGEIVGGTAR
jgi:HsdM N-terminal domain